MTAVREIPGVGDLGLDQAEGWLGHGRSRRVLLIDDDRDGADSLQLLLELYGFEVRVAYDGIRGLLAAREFQPAVVICDLAMPALDGHAVARHLRADASLGDLLLIAATGVGLPEERCKAARAGFDLFFLKPVDPERLVALLQRFFRFGTLRRMCEQPAVLAS